MHTRRPFRFSALRNRRRGNADCSGRGGPGRESIAASKVVEPSFYGTVGSANNANWLGHRSSAAEGPAVTESGTEIIDHQGDAAASCRFWERIRPEDPQLACKPVGHLGPISLGTQIYRRPDAVSDRTPQHGGSELQQVIRGAGGKGWQSVHGEFRRPAGARAADKQPKRESKPRQIYSFGRLQVWRVDRSGCDSRRRNRYIVRAGF